MKKLILISAAVILRLSHPASAGTVALVYENEESVRSGSVVVGAVTPDGIVISAKLALAANATLLVGVPGQPLKKAVLSKLDAPSDIALIHPGADVMNADLQKIYQTRAQSYLAFFPTDPSVGQPAPTVAVSTVPYLIKMNGVEIGPEPIELAYKNRKSDLKFEIIRLSTTPVWYMDAIFSAEPKLSFWKKGKQQSLTDVPMPNFRHSQQMMFKPLALGKSVVLPIEAYFMEEGAYTITLLIKSKTDQFESKIPVIFKSKR
jgi:hypothetical protein